MFAPYEPYIPKGRGETLDKLGSMMLGSPRFEDDSGYFPGKNIDTEFYALNEALKLMRKRLGEETYLRLASLSDRMRAHFDADPNYDNGETEKGSKIILEMMDILRGKTSVSRAGQPEL